MQIVDQQFRRKTNLTIFIASIVLTIVLGFFLLLPKYQDYQNKKQALADAQKKLADMNNTQKKVNLAGQQLSNNEADLQKIDMAIPTDQNLPDLYAYVETMAQAANLKVTALEAMQPTEQAAQPKPNAGALNGIANTLNGNNRSADATTSPSPSETASSGSKALNLPPNISTTELSMQVTGDLGSFNQFLSSVEDSLRLMDVESIDVSGVPNRKDLAFKLTLRAYYQNSSASNSTVVSSAQ